MNFRNTLLAMGALTLFTGLASAQVVVGGFTNQPAGPLACTANVSVPNQLRSEGMTELIGDIVLTCTGGNPLQPGQLVPTANITVSLATNVTSRLISCTGNGSQVCSEAMLLIDEPATNATGNAGAGPQAPIKTCTNSAGASVVGLAGDCLQGVSTGAGASAGVPAGQTVACSAITNVNQCAFASSLAPQNAFFGIVNANQVIFNGIPVNPPATGGVARVFRITNVRANASALGAGGLAGTTQLLASISISGSASLPVVNPVQIAGFIQSGLSTSLRNTTNSGGGGNTALPQCGGGGPTALSILRYTENFATAFKTRNSPTEITGSGQLGTPVQTVPGKIYFSESGLQLASNDKVGTADYGTRLKAVFNNVPAGVRIYVSTTNVRNDFFNPVVTQPAANSTDSFARLVASETGGYAEASGNTAITIGSTQFTNSLVEIPINNGSGTAVWEVINTNPNAIEGISTPSGTTVQNPATFDFGVWQSFTANPGANTPPVGQATVSMSFAPTPPAFSAAAGGSASISLTIPRFADTSVATNILSITLCNTALLFPFVTNQAGFDTGLAISNTTTDPFGTRAQAGTCDLNFYGASAPPKVTTPNVPTGTTYVTLASTAAAGFQGYMIAVCNFQLAHGFAFVSDIGARDIAMGYLALVIDSGTGARNNKNEQLNN